jgi:hypothetical protein
VFDEEGKIIGVNCRGWDFRGGEHEGNNLSTIGPIAAALELTFRIEQLPPKSWEYSQVPPHRHGTEFAFNEQATIGHIDLA